MVEAGESTGAISLVPTRGSIPSRPNICIRLWSLRSVIPIRWPICCHRSLHHSLSASVLLYARMTFWVVDNWISSSLVSSWPMSSRTLIFAPLIKGGKSTPIHVFVMALLFCAWNGYNQSAFHCFWVSYDHFWLRWQTIIGKSICFYYLSFTSICRRPQTISMVSVSVLQVCHCS